MAVTVKRITLWRCEVADRPGALADALEPLASAKANLGVVMAYGYPNEPRKAAIEIQPVSGAKAKAAAKTAGLAEASIPTLLVAGDDRPGVGHAISRAVADAGINMDFMVAQVIGRKFQSIIGFKAEADAKRAAGLIKKAAGRKGR